MANPFLAKKERESAALGEALRALNTRHNKVIPFADLDKRDQKHWISQGEFLYDEMNRILTRKKET